jgi:tetratricopeptide (TPR) repeat protein
MVMDIGDGAIVRRRLMLRDAVSMLILVLITGVLFAITLFLFRSFTSHRAELAERWSDRGRRALQANRASEAIADLRTALLYAPGTHEYELLLARALGDAGFQLHNASLIDESYNYFLGLWETMPGDGYINLELARLAAHKGNREDAVHYYRAAIYGTWEEGDGVQRRAAVRAELARYFIDQHDLQNARTELLITGGNTPDTYERDINLGRLFEAAQDPKDAEAYYQKAIAARPDDPVALELAGRVAYSMADYPAAHRLLERAVAQHASDAGGDAELARNAGRMMALNPAPSLPQRERAARVFEIRTIARKRLEACKQNARGQTVTPAIQALAARWSGPDATSTLSTMLRDPARQDAALQLAYDTERELQSVCGPASGDDALVLQLAAPPFPKPSGDSE